MVRSTMTIQALLAIGLAAATMISCSSRETGRTYDANNLVSIGEVAGWTAQELPMAEGTTASVIALTGPTIADRSPVTVLITTERDRHPSTFDPTNSTPEMPAVEDGTATFGGAEVRWYVNRILINASGTNASSGGTPADSEGSADRGGSRLPSTEAVPYDPSNEEPLLYFSMPLRAGETYVDVSSSGSAAEMEAVKAALPAILGALRIE